ncbi:hypothetical protein ACX27_04130 [Nostoc piscinale CENA21]|uniref:Uncharacterized protein n=1 Tax=Nostoc piscinale CENA21 TaxID=224013 RepID=A0A0M4SIG0_9NOSO|nr:hypothetical protein [Nostoc piscinale]ALF52222.1 hypothetical protein ACX27_04130 [Nostoc piscinale CENA21]
MKLNLELTTQQATELELLLATVKDHGVQIQGVEANSYTQAIALVHERIQAWLNAKVVAQKPLEQRELITEMRQAREKHFGSE